MPRRLQGTRHNQFKYLPELNAAHFSQPLAARIKEPLYPDCDVCTSGCIKPATYLAASNISYPCRDRKSGATMACTTEQCSISSRSDIVQPLRTEYTKPYTSATFPCSRGGSNCMSGFPQRDSSAKAQMKIPQSASRAPNH